jgi:hypothetical protein
MPDMPKFANEAEEADWLYENREKIESEFVEAIQNCRVRRGLLSPQQLREIISVDVAREDFTKAGELADAAGVERATFMREIFHLALQNRRAG